ncbi:MAG: AMP-binding protein, partial [Polyangiaceae bacterium]|nr:AMP-binding protein [Polyangiaceae bacterium]
MTLNLASLLRESAKNHPTKAALVLGPMSISYAELDAYARRFAASLAEIGVKRGEHVALFLPNVPHFTIAYYAAHYLGAPVV